MHIFSLVGQLFDLGFDKGDYKTAINLEFAIQELEDQLDLVMIAEYMDESLVLMQRLLCWQLSDVVYFKQRVRRRHEPIKPEVKVGDNQSKQRLRQESIVERISMKEMRANEN